LLKSAGSVVTQVSAVVSIAVTWDLP